MRPLSEVYLSALTNVAPMPWTLDQCNDQGVCVKDANGMILLFEDFHSACTAHIDCSKMLAMWLVEFSNSRRSP